MSITRTTGAWILVVVLALQGRAAEHHSVQGILLEVNTTRHSIRVSCDEVPGVMEAMSMMFSVRHSQDLSSLAPGMTVRFDMIEGKGTLYAQNLHTIRVSNHEAEPTEAARLTFLHRTLNPAAAAKMVQVGQLVPDFALTDQRQRLVPLSQFKGKVVALTFAYSRCPNPSYCFRLSNNLAVLARRFKPRLGRDLALITIVIDPDNDRGKALQRYADTWKADPGAWHFLTGTLPEVRQAAEYFGMDFWSDEGFLTHSLHTAVIDGEGKLAANIEGNQFSSQQLVDLVETVLDRPPGTAFRPASTKQP